MSVCRRLIGSLLDNTYTQIGTRQKCFLLFFSSFSFPRLSLSLFFLFIFFCFVPHICHSNCECFPQRLPSHIFLSYRIQISPIWFALYSFITRSYSSLHIDRYMFFIVYIVCSFQSNYYFFSSFLSLYPKHRKHIRTNRERKKNSPSAVELTVRYDYD